MYPVQWQSHWHYPIVEHPHSTILNLGDIDELGMEASEIIELLKDVNTNSYQYVSPIAYRAFTGRTGIRDVPVMELKLNEDLARIYGGVTEALGKAGIEGRREFKYVPHVTIDLETMLHKLPVFVLLHPAELWYGGVHHVVGTAAARGKRPFDFRDNL